MGLIGGLAGRIAAVTVAAIVCAWLLVRWAYMPLRCSIVVTDVTTRTITAEQTVSDYDRLVRARRNLDDLAGIRESCATEVRVPMLLGANQELAGRLEDALRSYDEALTVDRRSEIYVARALVRLQLGQIEGAVEDYAVAVRINALLLDSIGSEEIRRRVEERLSAPR